MSEPTETIVLGPRGDGFALVRVDQHGNRTEMALSEANVMALSGIVRDQLQKLHERRSTPTMAEQGVERLTAPPVDKARVRPNLHRSALLMSLLDPWGNEAHFSLSAEVAKGLIADLVVDLQKLPAAPSLKH